MKPTQTGTFSGSLTTVRQLEEEIQPAPPERQSFVGECPEIEVVLKGKKIPFILDTGSPLSLLGRSLFQEICGNGTVEGAADIPWLSLQAADGLKIR